MKDIGTFGTLGEAWLSIVREIHENGVVRDYTDTVNEFFEVRECFDVALTVEKPFLPDPIIDAYKDEKEYEWMLRNFTDFSQVSALHNANSYAERLYRYGGEKNQIEWVIRRLIENPLQRSCTITTFEPLTDELYIPCVSLLDFQREIGGNRLHLTAYCRALDFGSKAYVNMAMLAEILCNVALRTGLFAGKLELVVKSAHYRTVDEARIERMIEAEQMKRK